HTLLSSRSRHPPRSSLFPYTTLFRSLGIRVVRDRSQRRLWLCQDSYIETIATRFNLICDGIAPATPMGMEHLVANKDIADQATTDRKSTRLNSSHVEISYAVFCLKKK